MRERFQHGHRGDIGRGVGDMLIGTDAALAEDDLVVALERDVFGAEQPIVERGGEVTATASSRPKLRML